MRRLLLAVVLVGGLGNRAWSVTGQAGTSGAQFLKIGAGARAAGMAEAFSAVADDPYALFYNPAGITNVRVPQVGAAHTSYFQGANYEVGAFAYPLPGGRGKEHSRDVVGFAIYNLSVADIERRSGDTAQPNGYFGAGDYSYNLSYARRLDRTLGVGVTGKIIHQTLDSFSSTAFGLDAGTQWTPRPDAARPITFAAVVRNIGTRPKYAGNESDPLPMGFTIGAGAPVYKNLIADIDVTKYRDTDLYVSAGTEYRHAFADELVGKLRLGYSSIRRKQDGFNGLALGAGMDFHRVGFDFAWVPYGDLGDTFRFSLQIKFDGGAPAQAAAPQATPAQAIATPGK